MGSFRAQHSSMFSDCMNFVSCMPDSDEDFELEPQPREMRAGVSFNNIPCLRIFTHARSEL